jgi:altronate hydrolase
MKRRVLKIHPDDNLIVALDNLQIGETIELDGIHYPIKENIKAKHKFATLDFAEGDTLIQYGITVGKAINTIEQGTAITTDNTRHSSQTYGKDGQTYEWKKPDVSKWQGASFQGVRRENGQIGTANYWLVVPLVFCQNRNVEQMKTALQDALGYSNETHYIDLARNLVKGHLTNESDASSMSEELVSLPQERVFPNLDGVKFLTHSAGCGGTREDALSFCKLLAGYIHHPNVAGATVFSLGCQNAQMSLLQEELSRLEPNGDTPVLWFEQQAYGKERTMMDAAIKGTFEGLVKANQYQREAVPLSALKIGVECGGSDGFSGLSANPLIGRVVDKAVALGGASILGEFPELCGVEQNMLDRCTRPELKSRFSGLMKAYEAHALAAGASFDMNPSPGNIRDGLITDAMKSAGAALKGGAAPVSDVLDYTEVVTQPGLNLLCTPGNDVESTTALVASGANLILFSTGLGTPTGNPIVPVLKISSNSTIAERMPDIIDFDAGPIVTGENTLDVLSNDLFELCLETVSGAYATKAKRLGQDDFIPWKRGVSL